MGDLGVKPVTAYGPIRRTLPDVAVFFAGAVVGMLLLVIAQVVMR